MGSREDSPLEALKSWHWRLGRPCPLPSGCVQEGVERRSGEEICMKLPALQRVYSDQIVFFRAWELGQGVGGGWNSEQGRESSPHKLCGHSLTPLLVSGLANPLPLIGIPFGWSLAPSQGGGASKAGSYLHPPSSFPRWGGFTPLIAPSGICYL